MGAPQYLLAGDAPVAQAEVLSAVAAADALELFDDRVNRVIEVQPVELAGVEGYAVLD